MKRTVTLASLFAVFGCFGCIEVPELELCRYAHAKYDECGIDFASEAVCDDLEYCRSGCVMGSDCQDIALGMLGAPTSYGDCAAACGD